MRAVGDAAPADPETATAPVRSGQRIAALDVLRGIALFGIFIMNMPGFWGRLGPAQETALAVALFVAVQLPISVWWLGRFRYGPVEYLWRPVTYGRGAL